MGCCSCVEVVLLCGIAGLPGVVGVSIGEVGSASCMVISGGVKVVGLGDSEPASLLGGWVLGSALSIAFTATWASCGAVVSRPVVMVVVELRIRNCVTRRRSSRSRAGRNSFGNRTWRVRSCFLVASGTESSEFEFTVEFEDSLVPIGRDGSGRLDMELSNCVTNVRGGGSSGGDIAFVEAVVSAYFVLCTL